MILILSKDVKRLEIIHQKTDFDPFKITKRIVYNRVVNYLIICLLFLTSTSIQALELQATPSKSDSKYLKMHYDHNITKYKVPKVERPFPRAIRMLAQGMHVQATDYKNYLRYTLNANTPGYKKTKIAKVHTGEDLTAQQYVVWKRSAPVDTDRPLDLYVTGKKTFFTLKLPDGDEVYTHDGRFTLDPENQLITIAHNLPVLGENGPIYLETENVVIDTRGLIKYGGEIIDKLKITSFTSTDGLWTYDGTIIYVHNPEKTSIIDNTHYFIKQGFFEGSNEEPGYFSSKLSVPWYESTAYGTKKYLENYEKLFDAAEVKTNE